MESRTFDLACFAIVGVVIIVAVAFIALQSFDNSNVVSEKPFKRPVSNQTKLTGMVVNTNPCAFPQCYYSGFGKYCYSEKETVDLTLPESQDGKLCLKKTKLSCSAGDWKPNKLAEVVC